MNVRFFPLGIAGALCVDAHATTVYLTFDGGPHPNTEVILQALAEVKDVQGDHTPATFFLVGDSWRAFSPKPGATDADESRKDRQKEAFKKIEGATPKYQFGNRTHTTVPEKLSEYVTSYSHPLGDAAKRQFRANLSDNDHWFKGLIKDTQFKFEFARLPGAGGRLSSLEYLRKETESLGLKHREWDLEFAPNDKLAWVSNKDWQGITGVACSSKIFPPEGAIILFHDSHWDSKDLLVRILNLLKSKGYDFKRLP